MVLSVKQAIYGYLDNRVIKGADIFAAQFLVVSGFVRQSMYFMISLIDVKATAELVCANLEDIRYIIDQASEASAGTYVDKASKM